MEGIFLQPSPPPPLPTPLDIPVKLQYLLKFLGLWKPPTRQHFQSLLLGEYGYFLELHNNDFIVTSVVVDPEIREPHLIKALH